MKTLQKVFPLHHKNYNNDNCRKVMITKIQEHVSKVFWRVDQIKKNYHYNLSKGSGSFPNKIPNSKNFGRFLESEFILLKQVDFDLSKLFHFS